RQRWQPSRATLVVAGDVDPATLVARLEPTLGRWKAAAPGAPAQLPVAAAAPQVAPSRLLVADRPGAEQSDVRLGLVGPGRADPRFYAFEVLRTALGDGFTSRLTQRLREELGITYGAQALMDWRLRRGPFAIATALVTAETGTGIAETLRILGELAKVEMPANELEKSKQNLIRALPAELESNLSTSAAIAGLVQLGLSPSWYGTYAAKIRRVSAREVRAAAQALLPANKMILAVVGDLSVLRAALAPLGLGPALPHDPYGMVQPAPAPAP
ncbi:MAG TPA: insulinase family protein, partial [Kofleriaceae bacterium]|nr:insulinase family protein [Kofleriaceae bacterium]